ncbi:MAG: mechanosensitive ion channel [Campylobacterota bacterium]|nr:mechanosensitive ion channel [Campylobacterota bacterium]
MLHRTLLLLLLLFSIAVGADSKPLQTDLPAETNTPEEITFILVNDVPDQANSAIVELGNIHGKLLVSEQDKELEKSIEAFIESLQDEYENPVYSDLENESIRKLQKLYQQWSISYKQFKEWKTGLDQHVTKHSDAIKAFEKSEILWSQTALKAKAEDAPEAITLRIDEVLAKLKSYHDETKITYDVLLTCSNSVSSEMLKISELMKRIKEVEEKQSNRLFVQESEPIFWLFGTDEVSLSGYFPALFVSVGDMLNDARIYLVTNKDRLIIHGFITVVLLILMIYLYVLDKRRELFIKRDEKVWGSVTFVSRPISATIILSLFSIIFIYSDRPAVLGQLGMMLGVIPIVIIFRRMADIRFMRYVYTIAIIFTMVFMIRSIGEFEIINRLLLLGITIGIIAGFFQLVQKNSFIYELPINGWFRFLLKLVPLVYVIMAVSIAANLYGSVTLATRISEGMTITLMFLLLMYAISQLFIGLAVLFIRRRASESLYIVKAYSREMQGSVSYFITVVSFGIWAYYSAKTFGVLTPVKAWLDELVMHKWYFGSVSITIEAIGSFMFVLMMTWLIIKAVRMFLHLEVFPRIKLPRGVPTAISMVIRYFIVALGFLLALSSLGLNMSHLGLLAGALGVGLGFGLRNIIANFVSGIIMVFERPVQIGDTIEMDNTFGKVKSIGVRSSSVETFDGSEVIVPNADFISQKVTNWTLSDNQRRAELLFKVAFGSDPHQVLALMKEVALNHEYVLDDPEPAAAFKGFGEYYLEFKLYYWVSEEIIRTKSEVALGVYDAIRKAGIAMPIPSHNITMPEKDDI